jgi:nicotinate-nucleotide adenylyltransferase
LKLGLFGGTFNPIHHGHLLMAEYAREAFKLEKVIFVPTGQPPHRQAPRTSAQHRSAMVRLAIQGNSFFTMSDWEMRQKRVVYSYETLAYFTSQSARDRYYFILGSDSLAQLPTWRESVLLLKRYDFLVVERPEAPWGKISPRLRRQVHQVPSDPVPFAGQDIRQRVRQGRSIRYQVPEAVRRYILAHHLYQKPE